MASLPLSSTSPFLSKKPYFLSTHAKAKQGQVSVNASQNQKDNNNAKKSPTPNDIKLERRNVLLGIGGLYGTSRLPALAEPIQAPDLAKCTTGMDLNTGNPIYENCCMPPSEYYTDFPSKTMRCRPAAHLVDDRYMAKLERAVQLMKDLPDDDPRSFSQQVKVHCAYCSLAYEQTPGSDVKLQIHYNWLFYPWHRWYLYFYERILGKLIDDPTFALPYWNWDSPAGMVIPSFFVAKDSPLYDARRNPDHLPPTIADLQFDGETSTDPPEKIISRNLAEMYNEMIRTTTLEDFYGSKYVVGTGTDYDDVARTSGSIERGSHSALHRFVGEYATADNLEGFDLGNLSTSAKDPIFFGHHVNIDRLWSIWRRKRGSRKPKEFHDRDWLEAKFLFYDENKQLVRVKVGDALEHEKLGYVYEEAPLPWECFRPMPHFKKSRVASRSEVPEITFPVKLDKTVKVKVNRPKKSRSKKEKEEEDELLVIEFEADSAKFVRFEVFVNDEDDNVSELIDKAEYAGSYSHVPHGSSKNKMKTKIRLGLNELLEDLDVEDDDKLLVSVVPKAGGEHISIGGVKIIYVSE